MTLLELVRAAAQAPLRKEAVAAACAKLSLEHQQLYHAFAQEVADGYRSGRYSWPDADFSRFLRGQIQDEASYEILREVERRVGEQS